MIDWSIGKRKIEVWRTDCQSQMVPWGRTGDDPGIFALQKPQTVNYMHWAMQRRNNAEAEKTKKFLKVWFLQYLRFPFTNLQNIPGSAWVQVNPLSVYTFPHVLDVIKVQINWLHDSISRFFPKHHLFNNFSTFFFFWKSLFAAKEKVWVFVINVVEIQICPPRKGVFINSHSPEN